MGGGVRWLFEPGGRLGPGSPGFGVLAGQLHVAFAVSAVLSLAAAVAAMTVLRHLHQADPEGEPQAHSDAVGPDAVRTDGLLDR
jgi:hypothetical protein